MEIFPLIEIQSQQVPTTHQIQSQSLETLNQNNQIPTHQLNPVYHHFPIYANWEVVTICAKLAFLLDDDVALGSGEWAKWAAGAVDEFAEEFYEL